MDGVNASFSHGSGLVFASLHLKNKLKIKEILHIWRRMLNFAD
jgi:hypothetical protein